MRCLLLVVGCWLLVVALLVVGCWLLFVGVVCCLLFVFVFVFMFVCVCGTSVQMKNLLWISGVLLINLQGDHPCTVCDGPTKRPQYTAHHRDVPAY